MPRNERDAISEALKIVPAKWRAEFRQFVQSGQASEAFFAFLEQNEKCLDACDAILDADEDMTLIMGVANEEEPVRPLIVGTGK